MTAALPTKSRTYQNHTLDSERWLQIDRRANDIIIATPYKSGTTWMQAIVLHLIFQDLVPRQVDEVSRWVDAATRPIQDLRDVLGAQTHRRCLKSHLPMGGFYYRAEDKMIVVGRDPRDVFMSMWNHYSGYTDVAYAKHNDWPGRPGAPLPQCPAEIREFWNMWIGRGWFDWEHEGYPFWSNLHHMQTWWEHRDLPNILLVHYNDLLADLAGGVARVAWFLDIDCSADMVAAIADKTSFKSMKRDAEQVAGDPSGMLAGGAKQFIYKGTNGRWKAVLTDDDLSAYDRTAARELSADCRVWLQANDT
ncbi:MAG: sulfotransferase domain-containing protein [Paracoccaceae bacterium]